jgi:hypothetical protein
MIHLLHYCFQSLLLFLGLLGLLSVVTLLVRTGLKTKEEEKRSLRKFSEELNVDVKLASRIVFVVMGVVISFSSGYIVREHELTVSTVTYTFVNISSPSEPDTNFDIQPARMPAISVKLCSNTVDWKFGEVLKDLTFEQRPGCKRVIVYHRFTKGEENASIQVR